MSRGIGLGSPKEIKNNAKSVCFDGEGYLWLFNGTHVKRYFLKDFTSMKQSEIDSIVALNTDFTATTFWHSPVLVDDYIYVASDLIFNSLQKIDIRNGSKTTITTPVKMNSNIIFEGSKIWMVSDQVDSQSDDKHKMYTYDIYTGEWNFSRITTKKQKEAFKIWSVGTDYVFTSNWTNFSCSYFNKITGAFIGSFPINGYPGSAADVTNHTALVASFSGMISVVDGTTLAVSNLYNTLIDVNDSTGSLIYFQDQIWFISSNDLGRVLMSTKEVNHTSIDNQDAKILLSVGLDTVDASYTTQTTYSLTDSAFKQIILVPQYSYKDINNQTQTEPAKIVLVGSNITIINPNEVRFVFDRPEVRPSMVYAAGGGMVTTGDTGYIGEFG